MMQRYVGISVVCFWTSFSWAASVGGPPGWPGISHHWPPALKQAVGSAYEATGSNSPVWFTVSEGILSEVFYPSVDQPQVGSLEFVVTDGNGFFSEQKTGTSTQVRYLNEGMSVHISGEDRLGLYSFEQEIVTDTASPTLRIHTDFKWKQDGMRVFVLFKPTVNHSAEKNLGFARKEGLYATHLNPGTQPTYLALLSSVPWVTSSVGYVGISDGWQDLFKNFHLSSDPWHEAGPGNIMLTGEVEVGSGGIFSYDLALSFGSSRTEAETYASTSLRSLPFDQARAHYEAGWQGYLEEIQNSSLSMKSRPILDTPFVRQSAQIIKMHEDKRRRGAIVASLSSPTLPGRNSDEIGGYHLVWPRDLYHAAMGLLAAGDTRTPIDVLHYFASTQNNNGSWPVNFWTDGKPHRPGLRLDDVALPILLAGQLQSRGIYRLTSEDLEMVRKATSFLLSRGPTTPQDRWEEANGFVTSTLAVEIAALKTATLLTHDPGPERVASEWQASIETWTLGQSHLFENIYYLSHGESKTLGPEVMDGGFLELVRMGIRDAKDPRILATLKLYDDPKLGMGASHPNNPERIIYRRYYRPVYNLPHIDGYWPLLAGERGHYAVAAKNLEVARNELDALEQSATPTGLLPEHLLAPFRVRLGVACPLVWAHAEDILLHRSIEEGMVFDAPGTN